MTRFTLQKLHGGVETYIFQLGSAMDKDMLFEIMDEISEFCGNECSSVFCCPEEDCILYRIEQIIINEL